MLSNKPTRLRNHPSIRNLVRETSLSMNDIIYPIFVVEGEKIRREIPSMKNQYHLSVDMLIEEVSNLKEKEINKLIIFGIPENKDDLGTEAYSENGVVQRAIREIRSSFDDIYIITDVCLCQYKNDGHCCIFNQDGTINNDITLELLGKIALSHAQAGAHMVAPSDMMDGRVTRIRQVLDECGDSNIPIMSYSAKYASYFYGPFREAASSSPTFGDRRSYQMDPANSREAIKEMKLDIMEGADILMVKPAMSYLDIIKNAKEYFNVPIAAYQVSGEYSMIQNAIDSGIMDKRVIYESLISIKRSGADIIITYFAKELKEIIEEIQ